MEYVPWMKPLFLSDDVIKMADGTMRNLAALRMSKPLNFRLSTECASYISRFSNAIWCGSMDLVHTTLIEYSYATWAWFKSMRMLRTCWACSHGIGTKNIETQAKINTLKQMINDRLYTTKVTQQHFKHSNICFKSSVLNNVLRMY